MDKRIYNRFTLKQLILMIVSCLFLLSGCSPKKQYKELNLENIDKISITREIDHENKITAEVDKNYYPIVYDLVTNLSMSKSDDGYTGFTGYKLSIKCGDAFYKYYVTWDFIQININKETNQYCSYKLDEDYYEEIFLKQFNNIVDLYFPLSNLTFVESITINNNEQEKVFERDKLSYSNIQRFDGLVNRLQSIELNEEMNIINDDALYTIKVKTYYKEYDISIYETAISINGINYSCDTKNLINSINQLS